MSDFDITTAMQTEAFATLCASAAAQASDRGGACQMPRQLAGGNGGARLVCPLRAGEFAGRQDDPLLANSKLYHLARHDAASAWVAMIGSTASIGAAIYLMMWPTAYMAAAAAITCGILPRRHCCCGWR